MSPTTSETENEPTSSMTNNKSDTMQTSDNLILNTNFDFHAPAFSPHHLDGDTKRSQKKGIIDHVLDNGERVVIVDPNVSEGEDNDDEDQQQPETSQSQQSPLDKAISSLFAAASTNQFQAQPRKRATSPTPKTVSGILAKRRKVDKPQKRASEPDFTSLTESLLDPTSILSAWTSTSPVKQKPTSSRPSSSNSDLCTSKSSLSDSGIVSADEQLPIFSPKQKNQSSKRNE